MNMTCTRKILALTLAFAAIFLVAIEKVEAFDFDGAAQRYGVPPEILEAISLVESRRNPLAVGVNKNKTVDLGHMQVNSDWNGKKGIDWSKLTDSQYCTYVAAWILANELQRYNGNIWDAVASYHIGKSPADWEKDAAQLEGRKKEMALWRAARGRWYANAVYNAMQKLPSNKRSQNSVQQVQRNVQNNERETEQASASTVAATSSWYVPSPFGSAVAR